MVTLPRIGIVGGVGWPSTVEYYRGICEGVNGHYAAKGGTPPLPTPPISIDSLDMSTTRSSWGLLATASLFIAERAPWSARFWTISLVVTAVFLALGLLLRGMEVLSVGIARLCSGPPHENGPELERGVSRLMTLILVGGVCLCGFLAMVTYAILARIDHGFAVFG